MANNYNDINKALGRIEAKLETLEKSSEKQGATLDDIKHRLTKVEGKSATYGAILGTAAGIVTTIVTAAIKNRLGS